MRIGFDVSDLSTGRADGTTRYTYELAKRLPDIAPHYEWQYFSPGAIQREYEMPNVKYELRISKWPKWWTQTRLPGDLYKYGTDVLFIPIQQIPFIRPGKMRTVAVVHDLAVHEYPEQFTYKDWLLLHAFSAYAVREADKIVAVSKATADDIAKYYGREKDVHVVRHGVDHERFRLPRSSQEKSEAQSKLYQRYPRARRPYILYVGQIQPRKNLIKLIEAFEILALKDKDLHLVIAGGHGWLREPIVKKAESSKFRSRICMTGAVEDNFLAPLYWHAETFVLPSLYEGFGMTILEAMACGCPVVTGNISAMPEVAGGAAVIVDPTKTGAIAQGIQEARDNKNELATKGIKRAKNFNWGDTAQKTAAILLKS